MWSIADLERISLTMWNAAEEIDYDGWILRFAGGYSGRANSVQTYGGSSLPVAEKVAYCEAMYAQRKIPIIFKLTQATQPANLDSFLRENGYTLRNTTSIQLLNIADKPFMMNDQFGVYVGNAENGIFPPDIATWMEHAQRIKQFTPSDDVSHRTILSYLALPTGYGVVHDPKGQVVAVGICVYDPQAKLCGIFDIAVHPEHRRNGYGRIIATSLIAWGQAQGATHVYLQVDMSNTNALPLYASLGFDEVYRYWYLHKRA
jgi:ribosomal protein S18 acetylase RimI-like enzyme